MKVGMLSVLVGVVGMILIANLELPLSTASLYLWLGDEVVALHFLLGDVVVTPHYLTWDAAASMRKKEHDQKWHLDPLRMLGLLFLTIVVSSTEVTHCPGP